MYSPCTTLKSITSTFNSQTAKFIQDCNLIVSDAGGCTSIPNSILPESLTTKEPKASGHTLTFASIHDEAMAMARELEVAELYTQTILRRTVKMAHCDEEGLETFHNYQQETTVATGINVKNLTYFAEQGKPEAKGSASDLFPGSGNNFGKRVAESHIMTTPKDVNG